MTEIPLHWQTISELSRRIHNGSLSPVALMEHLLNRIETLDGRLHSFRLLSRERALAAARASELALRAGQDMGRLCRKFCLRGREGAVAPAGGRLRRPGSRTVRPQ
jgi:Asp-tRNA(Asn)/Glu-tRNA(Gln) amidotransferase A subunit family amidase